MENAEENLNLALGQLLIEEDELKYKVLEICPNNRFQKFNDELGFSPLKTVHRAYDAEYGKEVLWHTIKVRKISAKHLSRIRSELSLMKSINHDSLLNCLDYWIKPQQKQIIFITEITDGGCLRNYLDKIKTTKLKVIKGWCEQILKGLAYLHQQEKPIVHQSLRCQNIYINSTTNEIKLGELGLLFTSVDPFLSLSGYFEWMAPELLEEKQSPSSDIYSFGMTVLELITGKNPYSECKNTVQLCRRISKNIKPRNLKDVPYPELRQIIESCITLDSNSRPTAKDLLAHSFWKSTEETDNFSIKTFFEEKQVGNLNRRTSKQTTKQQKIIKLNQNILKRQSETEVKFIFEFSKKAFEIKIDKEPDDQFEQFIDLLTKKLEERNPSKESHSHPSGQNKFEQREIIRQDHTHFLSSQNPTMKTMRFDYLYESRVKEDEQKKSSANLSEFNEPAQGDILIKIQQLFIGMYEMYRNKLDGWHIEQSSQEKRFLLERRQLEQLQSLEKQRVMIKRKDKSNHAFLANSINFIDFLNNSQAPWPNEAYEIEKDIIMKNAFISSGKPEDVLSLNFSSIQNYRQDIRADFQLYMMGQQNQLTNPKLNESFIQQKTELVMKTKVVQILQVKEQIVKQQKQRYVKTQQEQIKIVKQHFEKKQSIKSSAGKEKTEEEPQYFTNNSLY